GQFQRSGQQLSADDAQARVFDMQFAPGPGLEVPPGTEHIQAYQSQQAAAEEHRQPGADIGHALDQVGLAEQHGASGEQHAEDEGEGAEDDQHADLAGTQPLAGVGPVAHHGAREYRGADVVGQSVGGEG